MNVASEFALQTLLFVSRMVSEGDFKTPEKMGISHAQMTKISDLTTQDIHILSVFTQANFLSVKFDPNALDVALAIISDNNLRRHEIYELLREGASYPVMKYIYGLTTTDMATCRKVLNLPRETGRPAFPSEDEQNKLSEYITTVDIKKTDKLANKLLLASRKTGIKISVIWVVLNRWLKEQASPELA